MRDSSLESSVVAGGHEQTEHTDLQDPVLTFVQQGAQAPRIAIDLVRSGHGVGGEADRYPRADCACRFAEKAAGQKAGIARHWVSH